MATVEIECDYPPASLPTDCHPSGLPDTDRALEVNSPTRCLIQKESPISRRGKKEPPESSGLRIARFGYAATNLGISCVWRTLRYQPWPDFLFKKVEEGRKNKPLQRDSLGLGAKPRLN